MNTIVFTKSGEHVNYESLSDTYSKMEIFDSISSIYADDQIDRIQVKYDAINVATVDGRTSTESGRIVTVQTLAELRSELGKYGG